MTGMSAQTTAVDDGKYFPEPNGGNPEELLLGTFPATLIRIEDPQTKLNEEGEEMTSQKFAWILDGYPDRELWSFINPYGRSERSNFYKAYKALMGKEPVRGSRIKQDDLLNRRCVLICEENPKKPGYTKVTGYLPLPKPRPVAAQARAARAVDDLEAEFDKVPFD